MAFSNDWGFMDSEGFNSYQPVQPLDLKEGKREGRKKQRKHHLTFGSLKKGKRDIHSYLWKKLLKNLIHGLN